MTSGVSPELLQRYYRKHGVTLFKEGFHIHAFQVFYKNANERKDARSLFYLSWMILFGCGCNSNPTLSVRILRKFLKHAKGKVLRQEAEKLLAFCYLHKNIKYADKKWAGWILGEDSILDLRNEDSF